MPRTVVYARSNPADQHYKALLADEPNAPSPDRDQQLRADAGRLAETVAPQAVQLHYLAGLADRDDALSTLGRGEAWAAAAEAAAAGAPASGGAEVAAKTVSAAEPTTTDGYLEKLAKYVPAESITLTTLAFAALEPSSSDVWWLVAAGAVANVLYLFGTALQGRREAPMPRWYFYLLSAGALVLWSIAIIGPVGTKAGISGSNAEAAKTFVLAAAAFLIPLLDSIITGITELLEERSKAPRPPERHDPSSVDAAALA